MDSLAEGGGQSLTYGTRLVQDENFEMRAKLKQRKADVQREHSPLPTKVQLKTPMLRASEKER